MEWSFALFLSLLALAVILHHFGIRRLSREAPALLAMGPALIMLLAWLLLILSSIGSLGLLVIPAAIAAGVPFLLLAPRCVSSTLRAPIRRAWSTPRRSMP
jgi:hypothetical protein